MVTQLSDIAHLKPVPKMSKQTRHSKIILGIFFPWTKLFQIWNGHSPDVTETKNVFSFVILGVFFSQSAVKGNADDIAIVKISDANSTLRHRHTFILYASNISQYSSESLDTCVLM